MKNTILRRSLDYWFEEMDIRPRIVGEFDDSAMLKIMGSKGVGLFPVASVIRKEDRRKPTGLGLMFVGPMISEAG